MDEKKFCTKCGAELKPGDRFCAGCGAAAEGTGTAIEGMSNGAESGPAKQAKSGKRKNILWGIGAVLVIAAVFSFLPGDFMSAPGENDATAESVTDLYQYRAAMEEVIIADLGFTKNDTGVYPSMDEMTFLFSEGNMYMISLGKSSVGKYSFLGAQVGDDMEQAKEGFQKFFTYESSTTTDDTVRDVYMDNEWSGMLMVEYGMSDGKISAITYTDMSDILGSDMTGGYLDGDMSDMTGGYLDDGMSGDSAAWKDETVTGADIFDVDYGYIYGGYIDHACDIAIKDTSEIAYVFYDVDKDGYYEFFIENNENMYDVYTTNGTTGSFLGNVQCFNSEICEYREGVGFYTDYCQMGYEVITFVTIQNGVLAEETVFDGETENYGYREDGTPYEELSYPVRAHTLGEGLLW